MIARLWTWRPKLETIRTVAASVAALMLIGTVIFQNIEIRDARRSQECRFDLSVDVNSIKDLIDVSVARIVEASVLIREPSDEPPAEVERLQTVIRGEAAKIREYVRDLLPAMERRERAVAICNE